MSKVYSYREWTVYNIHITWDLQYLIQMENETIFVD